MRLDKYLKVSRLIKRRTLAKEACQSGKVLVNASTAKPGTEVDIGDIIEIIYGDKTLKVEIVILNEIVKKGEAKEMYKVL